MHRGGSKIQVGEGKKERNSAVPSFPLAHSSFGVSSDEWHVAIHLQGCASVMNWEHLESRQEKKSTIDGHEAEKKGGKGGKKSNQC